MSYRLIECKFFGGIMGLLDDLWGTGEDPRWDKNFTAPVYGVDADGNDVTVSLGRKSREGETLIASGHVDEETFNAVDKKGNHIGHDHYGGTGKKGDRGCYQNDKWSDDKQNN